MIILKGVNVIKKKLLYFLLCGVLLIGLSACSDNNSLIGLPSEDSENITRVKNKTNSRVYADYTLNEVLEKDLNNIYYSEEYDSKSYSDYNRY